MSRRKCQNTKNRLKFKTWPPSPLKVYSFLSFYIHRSDLTLPHGRKSKVIGKQSDGLHRSPQTGTLWVMSGPQQHKALLCLLRSSLYINDFQSLLILSMPSQLYWIRSIADLHSLTCVELEEYLKNLLSRSLPNMFLKLLTFFAGISGSSISLRWRLKGRWQGSGPRLQAPASTRNVAFVSVTYIRMLNSDYFEKIAVKTLCFPTQSWGSNDRRVENSRRSRNWIAVKYGGNLCFWASMQFADFEILISISDFKTLWLVSQMFLCNTV